MQSGLVAAMVAGRDALLSAFTNSAVIKQAASAAWMPLAASILSDATNCILSAILRGSGRQGLGAAINLVGYWLVGMPLCFLLGKRAELPGLWAAIALTSTGVAAVQGACVLRFDWRHEVGRARELSALQAKAASEAEAEARARAQAQEHKGGGGGGYLMAVREEQGEEGDEEGGGERRRDQRSKPATTRVQKAPPLAPASSRELPLSLHAPASRAPSAAFSVEGPAAGSFSSSVAGGAGG
jgi:hypothetical protein